MFVEVVNMTNNTQFKTLVNTWLNQKQPMITPSTHASFTLIAENHLIPYFGKRKIGSITETDIQSYISYLHDAGRLDKTGGLTVKTIRDVILVLRLSMEFAYKERAIPLLNWDLVEYPKELGITTVFIVLFFSLLVVRHRASPRSLCLFFRRCCSFSNSSSVFGGLPSKEIRTFCFGVPCNMVSISLHSCFCFSVIVLSFPEDRKTEI